MTDRWYARHRQEWIAEMLKVYGFIDREHIMRKFEISMPQASIDLASFRTANPHTVTYNGSTKRYEVING